MARFYAVYSFSTKSDQCPSEGTVAPHMVLGRVHIPSKILALKAVGLSVLAHIFRPRHSPGLWPCYCLL